MKKRVLIVDDEKHITTFLSHALEAEDVEVVSAEDGQIALDYIYANDVDMVITDIKMPHVNGIQLFYAVKQRSPFTQVIVVTGYPSLEHISEMMEAGANDFIIKPFDIAHFKEVVSDGFRRIERWRGIRRELAFIGRK